MLTIDFLKKALGNCLKGYHPQIKRMGLIHVRGMVEWAGSEDIQAITPEEHTELLGRINEEIGKT